MAPGIGRRFAQGSDHGGDKEVAAQLQGMGRGRILADDRDAARELLQQWPDGRNRHSRAADDHPKLALSRNRRATEHRRADVVPTMGRVFLLKPLCELDADGAKPDVDRALGHRLDDPAAQQRAFYCLISEEHREDRFCIAHRFRRTCRGGRALKRLGRAVPHGDRVALLHEQCGNAGAHLAQAKKRNTHFIPRLRTKPGLQSAGRAHEPTCLVLTYCWGASPPPAADFSTPIALPETTRFTRRF